MGLTFDRIRTISRPRNFRLDAGHLDVWIKVADGGYR